MYRKIIEKKGHCLECGEEIRYGRQDKKFCNSTCRSRFNNRRAHNVSRIRARIIGALDRNHVILTRLLSLGMTGMSRQEMVQMGFNFEYFTSCTRPSSARLPEYACFDIAYKIRGDRACSFRRIGQEHDHSRNNCVSLQDMDIE